MYGFFINNRSLLTSFYLHPQKSAPDSRFALFHIKRGCAGGIEGNRRSACQLAGLPRGRTYPAGKTGAVTRRICDIVTFLWRTEPREAVFSADARHVALDKHNLAGARVSAMATDGFSEGRTARRTKSHCVPLPTNPLLAYTITIM